MCLILKRLYEFLSIILWFLKAINRVSCFKWTFMLCLHRTCLDICFKLPLGYEQLSLLMRQSNYVQIPSMSPITPGMVLINSLRPRRNGRYNVDDIFKCIFLKENVWIMTMISLKFVPKGSINNISALVQIMVWRRPGGKPLSEPMMVSLLTHICVTRPQWVNTLRPRQDGRHFPDYIFTCIAWIKMYGLLLRFHWSLFLKVQLIIFRHWCR